LPRQTSEESFLTRDHRRLAAIVSLDVAGYSRLMGIDESGTLAALKRHRRELIDPKIAEHAGRIVKTTGDGLLLEFPSVVDAVRCAVDVQRGMTERNDAVVPDQRLEFRIGINVGDIIIDGDDIFGDGVNVAARLEALADPGGICVTRVVRDQVLDKLSFTFHDLGAQQVKNIARPVDVYRVDLGLAPRNARKSDGGGPPRAAAMVAARRSVLALLTVGLAGIVVWWSVQSFRPGPAASPPTGSIAVLPFTSSTSDAEAGALADAVTADLTSALQRALTHSTVISHTVAAAYPGKPVDVRVVGRALNVRYLVEGEIRALGRQSVIKARLVETAGATDVWSDDVAFDQTRVADQQGQIVTRLAVQVKGALVAAETRRIVAEPLDRASADDLTWRADALTEANPESIDALVQARKLYDQALAVDPNLTSALMGKTLGLGMTLDVDPHADRERLIREYGEMSARLVAAAGREARAWNIRADALQRAWRWEGALEANARAQTIDRSRVGSIGQRADIMVAMGRPDEALKLVDEALALQPPAASQTAYLMSSRCRASMALGRYDDAIAACERQASLADSWEPHVYLIAAYAQAGNATRIAAEVAKVADQRPGFSIATHRALGESDVPAYQQQTERHLYAGLRKAGIPER
jgi:adenylate cyclase